MTGPARQLRPEVVLMCGVAGAGKTTFAKRLEAGGHVRLSIDEEIWRRFGRYGIDYPVGDYLSLGERAQDALRERLLELLAQGRDVVLDFSFWRHADRDRYKRLVEDAGGRWRLIYLPADPRLLRSRLADRSARFDANAAFPITDAILDAYLAAFEAPDGEGEEVVYPT